MNRPTTLLVTSALLFGLAGCGDAADEDSAAARETPADGEAASSSATSTASTAVPGELAENIYDAVKAGDWTTATAKLDSLQAAVAGPPVGQAEFDRAELDRLQGAVAAQDRVPALEASNALTRDFARATAAASPIPEEIVLLDYYGRELEIGAAEGDAGMERLRQTAADIRSTWDAVRPRVVERGGDAEASRFDGVVQRTEAARTPADYAEVATPVLDEVDRLEAVFMR